MIITIQTLTIAGLISLSTQATSAVLQETLADCLRYIALTECTACYRGPGDEIYKFANGLDYETVTCSIEDGGKCVDGVVRK